MSEGTILNGIPVPPPPVPRRRRPHLFLRLALAAARKAPVASGLVVSVILASSCWSAVWEADTRTESCTITHSQEVGTSYAKDGDATSSQDRIATTACGTLNVDNDPARLRFDARSDFTSLVPGDTYRMTIVGWAGAVFSTLPNVVAVQHAR